MTELCERKTSVKNKNKKKNKKNSRFTSNKRFLEKNRVIRTATKGQKQGVDLQRSALIHLSMVPPPPLLGVGGGEVGDCHVYRVVTPTYGASVGHTLPHLPPPILPSFHR